MQTNTKLSVNQAHKVASMAWSGSMELASVGPHGMPHELREALKAEKRERLPQALAKVGLVESAISGAERPMRHLGDIHGIRQSHVTAMMIGARLGKGTAGLASVMALRASLSEASEVLQAAWMAESEVK